MRRRRLLKVTASATALSAFAGCTQSGERGTEEPEETTDGTDTGPGSRPGNGTTDSTESETPEPTGRTEGGSSDQGWGSGGTMDGVDFSFSSRSPECGNGEDDVDITFDDDAGEVTLDGVIRGSDTCKRAQLGTVEYDDDADTLSVTVETTDIEECGAGATCVVDIEYEATFTFEDAIPSEASVSHGDRYGASAAHGSSSASASTSRKVTETPE